MSNNENNVRVGGGGISFCGLLAIVFITLKLCGVINWAWWIVLAPIWVPLVIGVVFFLIVFVVSFIFDR